MNKYNSRLWLLLTVVFAVVLTTAGLSHIVTHPWHEMPELGADGGKNIYTYLYHVLYGRGIWFQGMNYPYGEHIVYTDGQPLLSVPLSYLPERLGIGGALTVMWWVVALSYVLSIVYCYKILLQFQVRPLFAMLFAGLITMLSPQLFRISGHYALSVACVLPMLFYWTVRYHKERKNRYPVYIFCLGLIATFLHPYYAAVSLVWAGCYSAGYFVTTNGTLAAKAKHVLPLLVSVGLVFVLFGIVMKVTDPYTDRPKTPYGILANCTTIRDVICNSESPVWAAVARLLRTDKITAGGEGRSYVGLVVMIVSGLSVLIWLKNRKHDKSNQALEFHPVWLFMAVAALLFGMGAPFTWHMEWLLDYASALKQFRTLGRFSWIFYYIITVYAVVIINSWYTQLLSGGRKAAAQVLVLGCILLWSLEAAGYISRTHKKLDIGYGAYDTFVSTGTTDWPTFLKQQGYNKEDFQATLVLPFFEVGSEKLWIGNDENISAWAIAMGIQAGIQLHLPMMDGMMSRTSWDVAFRQARIVGGPYTDKRSLWYGRGEKPLLLIALDIAQLSPDEKYLLKSSDSIGKFQNCTIYSCYPGRVADSDGVYNSVSRWCKNVTGDTCCRYTGAWFIDHFNPGHEMGVFGEGAMPYKDAGRLVIAHVPLQPAYNMQQYEFSCWFRVPEDNYKSPEVLVEVLDSQQHILISKTAFTKESVDNIRLARPGKGCGREDGQQVSWLRTNLYFNMPINAKFVRCKLDDVQAHSYTAFDEVMIRPADAVIVTHYDKEYGYMINNHIYKHYE